MDRPRGAIVVGAHANGLGVVRSLAAHGIPLAIVSTRPFDVAQRSRWVGECHDLRGFHDDPESLVGFLEAGAPRWPDWAVFPTNDDALTVLARHHSRLSTRFRLVTDPWERIGRLVDKDSMHDLAVEAGLDVPHCHGPAVAESLARRDIAFPVVVKPVQHDRLLSRFAAKLFVADSPAQLEAACRRLAGVGLEGRVWDLVPGPDSNIYVDCLYLDGGGELRAAATVRKLRQNPPGTGGARVAEIVADIPALRASSLALLRRAGYRGMAFVEYKLDPRDGCHRFIEVNARPVLFNSLLNAAGIDLVHLAWCDFVLGEPRGGQPNGWRGVWIHLQADLLCTLFYRHVERLPATEILAPYRRPKTFAVWAANDPAPFAAQTLQTLRGAARALRRRSDRQALRRRIRAGSPG